MHVLHIIESLEFGGAEKVVVTLANSMAGSHEISICCVKRIGALAAELDKRIKVFCLEKPEGNDYMLPFRLAKIIRRNAYDVVHTHNWGVFLECGLAGVLAGTPVLIHTVHGPYNKYADNALAQLKLKLRHFFEGILASRFRRIVPVSDAIIEYLVRDISIRRKAILTIHNGIPVDNPPAASAAAMATTSTEVVFITVGRVAAIKNHELMLRALRQVLDAGGRARLVIVGDGPERPRVEQLISELNLAGSVDLLGFRSDVGDILATADAFIMTSRYEGISIAMLEAMRAGLPVVATRVGGIPETVQDGKTGILAASEDLDGIAQAMLRLVRSDELRRDMGRRGRAFLEQEYSLERMSACYLEQYSKPAG